MGNTTTLYRRILTKRDVAQDSVSELENRKKVQGELENWEKTCLHNAEQTIIFCEELLAFFD